MRVLNIKEVYAAFTKSIDGMAADFQSQVTSRAIYFPSKWKHNLFEPIGISGLTVKTHWTDLDHDLDQEEAKKLNVKAEPPRDSNGYVIEGSGNRKVLVQYTNGTCKAFVPQKRLLINMEPTIIISSDSS